MTVTDRMEEWSAVDHDHEAFEARLDDPTLIDVHAHVFAEGSLGRDPVTAERMVEWMDARGVDRTVLLATESPETSSLGPTWWTFEQAERYPDRFVPFCGVDPRHLVYGRENVEGRVAEYVERGARGFGEHKTGVAIDDERAQVLYEICEERGLPVLFHLDAKSCTDEIGLPGFERMLKRYPDLDFVAHAHGWWAHVSGDVTAEDLAEYPTGPVADGGRVGELLAEYDNCYADVSAGSGFNALTRDPAFGQRFLERHHDSLLFGTDYLAVGQRVPQFAFFERFDLAPDEWENVRFRNAEEVFL